MTAGQSVRLGAALDGGSSDGDGGDGAAGLGAGAADAVAGWAPRRFGIVRAASESRIVSAHGTASRQTAAATRNATRYAVKFGAR